MSMRSRPRRIIPKAIADVKDDSFTILYGEESIMRLKGNTLTLYEENYPKGQVSFLNLINHYLDWLNYRARIKRKGGRYVYTDNANTIPFETQATVQVPFSFGKPTRSDSNQDQRPVCGDVGVKAKKPKTVRKSSKREGRS